MTSVVNKPAEEGKQAEYIAEMMSLRFNNVDYQSRNTKVSKDTKELINSLFTYFGEQIRYILLQSVYASDSLGLVQLFTEH